MNTTETKTIKAIETSYSSYADDNRNITWINLCEKNKSLWWTHPFVKRTNNAKCYCTVEQLKNHIHYAGGVMEWLYCTAYVEEESSYDYPYFEVDHKMIRFDDGEVEKIFDNEDIANDDLICLVETDTGIIITYESSLPFDESELYND